MPYEKMTGEQVPAFLTEQPRTAKLATARADGRPHVAPVWYVVEDDGSILQHQLHVVLVPGGPVAPAQPRMPAGC